MTDLSQAIVNGFAIADTIKARREQEKQNGLNESYRRDTFAENRRQFGLGLADRKEARDQQGDQFDQTLKQRASEATDYRDISTRRLDLTRRSLKNEEGAQRYRVDQDSQKRIDAMAAAVGGQVSDLSATGFPDDGTQQFISSVLRDPQERGRISQEMFGEDVFRSAKDGTPLDRVIVKNGKVVLYGVRKKADGTYEPAIADKGRTADNSTPPLEIPVAKFVQGLTGVYGANPYFISAASEGQLFAGLRRPEGAPPSDEQVRTALVDAADQSTSVPSQPQAGAAAPTPADPAPSAAPTSSPAPAPVTPSGLSPDESAELEKLNKLSLDTTSSARLGWYNRGSGRDYSQAAGQLSEQSEPRRQELLAKQQAAEVAAKEQTQALAVSEAASARGLAVPPAPASDKSATNQQQDPQEDPSAAMYRQNRTYNEGLSRMYTANRTLRTPYSASDVAAFEQTGVASSALLRESADAEEAQQKRIDAGGANLDTIIGKLSDGDDFLKKSTGAMRDVAGLVNQMTYGAVGANESMARNVSSNLVKLTRMRDGIPGIGMDDPYARPIMAGIALANANASAVSDEQLEAQAQRVADAYSSSEKKPSDVQAALIAKLAISGATPQEHTERLGWIMALTPAQQARALQQLLQ